MLRIDEVEVKLITYGPRTSLKIDDAEIMVEPDLLIALEGIGTFKGITIEERMKELLEAGGDLKKIAFKMHRESTRRGHASISTSLMLQVEVRRCSRAASMVLVSPPFASYLQESQRRRKLSKDDFLMVRSVEQNEKLRRIYEKAIKASFEAYCWMIERGIPLEDARYIIPLASRTSLFMSTSLESIMGLILRSEENDQYYPEELKLIGEKLKSTSMLAAPMLTRARISFKSPFPTYPYPDPYKPEDPLMNYMIEKWKGFKPPILLSLSILPEAVSLLRDCMKRAATAQALSPVIQAIFLEQLSLAAYHQSIRHRTVPTAVESIYSAVDRVLRDPEENLIIPPKIEDDDRLLKKFREVSSTMLESYELLRRENVMPCDAIYLIPQALKIHVIRSYNTFNLLWPQGYIGTRSCSYAQWEERRIAYGIWRSIEEKVPELGGLMGEKCKLLGYCPEKKWCQIILKYRRYDDEVHASFQ